MHCPRSSVHSRLLCLFTYFFCGAFHISWAKRRSLRNSFHHFCRGTTISIAGLVSLEEDMHGKGEWVTQEKASWLLESLSALQSKLHKHATAHGTLFFSPVCTETEFNSPTSGQVSNSNCVSCMHYVFLNGYRYLSLDIHSWQNPCI